MIFNWNKTVKIVEEPSPPHLTVFCRLRERPARGGGEDDGGKIASALVIYFVLSIK